MSFVQQIYDFNYGADLVNQPLDDYREASFAIEEALEGFNTSMLAEAVSAESHSPKDISRAIVLLCKSSADTLLPAVLSDVDRADKAADAVVFAIGYLTKLRLSVDQINAVMEAVTTANLQKLSMPRDSFGKLQKPLTFVGPESTIQQILEQRT